MVIEIPGRNGLPKYIHPGKSSGTKCRCMSDMELTGTEMTYGKVGMGSALRPAFDRLRTEEHHKNINKRCEMEQRHTSQLS